MRRSHLRRGITSQDLKDVGMDIAKTGFAVALGITTAKGGEAIYNKMVKHKPTHTGTPRSTKKTTKK